MTGPSGARVEVADTWRALSSGVVGAVVHEVAWPTDLDTAARHHVVVGVATGPTPDEDAIDAWIRPRDALAVWRDRIEPFRADLVAGRRAPRRRVAELADPDPTWPAQARRVVARLHHAVGEFVVRVDHIGSTSVRGLPAKDLIDVQVVVRDLVAARKAASRAPECGLVHVAGAWDAPDRTGRRFREEVLVDADPGRPTNVNLRPMGDPVWRETLLFRDWLRADMRHRDA